MRLFEGTQFDIPPTCDRCGKLVPFADEELEKTIGKLSRRVDFQVSDHEVVLHGACDACVK